MSKPNARFWVAAAVAAGIVVVAGLGLGWHFWHGSPQPQPTIEIPLQSGTATIARRLKSGGAIRSEWLFRFYVTVTRQARRLKAGEYAFPPRTGLAQVARQLAQGKVISHAFTVPEGFTSWQIAEKLEAAGLASREAFLAAVRDPELARAWQIPADSLEGFLFPDTYQLAKGMLPRQIARRMVERFQRQIGNEYATAAQAQKISFLQLVTLASIIEREVRAPQEQPVVASVFYNRLRKKMRLESCATVLYGQGRSSGVLSFDDLHSVSPYNTYRHAGLPPGPIGNPGLGALRAAAYPAQSDFLFFVVRPDGRHEFSKDFETHKHAKWMQKRARQRKP